MRPTLKLQPAAVIGVGSSSALGKDERADNRPPSTSPVVSLDTIVPLDPGYIWSARLFETAALLFEIALLFSVKRGGRKLRLAFLIAEGL